MAGANSFEQSSEKERDRPLRGLLYMIGQLAEHINNTAWTRKASEKKYGTQSLSLWRTHPYLFKAFKVAVSRWLNSLPEPTDEPQIPNSEIIKAMQKYPAPEDFGASVASIFSALAMSSALLFKLRIKKPEEILSSIRGKIGPEHYEGFEYEFYGMEQARQDLELPAGKTTARRKSKL